ncbi:3-phosphoshikimate 1-carboxyvinyltransferase [Macrococcoides caseolyticum]|uniref:3-phosphoshikimate 1-carboxyvinyltransferase n=1 Tax=Macrococcoides caseolyticum TaxID=69966 RepID=UPI001F425F6A|nr:3-phosphoshikimate 1-carboxyvinyltransferase [Macrococcus caseolyticus]MCE4957067.1 3-phosphoshikimate 1-carboxyvinyltransferase [Macrococcus caseolyticus]
MKSNSLIGEIIVPGDKSITHRAIILGSLSSGKMHIFDPLLGEDCMRTINIFRQLGVSIHIDDAKKSITIESKGYRHFTQPTQVLDTGNSGTTTRLLSGVLAGLPFMTVMSGDDSIAERPMDRVIQPLQEMGIDIKGSRNNSRTPIVINSGNNQIDIQGIKYDMQVKSAQVKSAILFAGLYAHSDVFVKEQVTSRNHTELMFKQFGIKIDQHDDYIYLPTRSVEDLQTTDVQVPGDISSAAFFIVAGLIVPNSHIIIKNVGTNVTRSGIIEVVKAMGGNIKLTPVSNSAEPICNIEVKYTQALNATNISGELIPTLIDEIPIIALLMTQAKGRSVISDSEELKVKETNRIDKVVECLNQLGYHLEATDDGMIIYGQEKVEPTHLNLSSYHDHRIGMLLAIANLLEAQEIKIEHFDAVKVSYPSFLNDLIQLQGGH